MLWLTLPLLLLMTLVAFVVGGGAAIPPVEALMGTAGFDLEAGRARSRGFIEATGAFVSLGMAYGVAGVNVAHELVHRTDSRFDQAVGRWLLALTWDTSFAIEHVHGHHRNVGTELDPATARRGEYIFAFVLRSTIGQIRAAHDFEKQRLKRKRLADRPWTNRFWRGQLMTLAVVVVWVLFLGPAGLVLCLFSGAIGKLYLEVTNFIEHFGLVRLPGTRVEARHSWDSYRRLSTGMLYNLPLHSNHHKFATRPFWELKQTPTEAPTLPRGYMAMILMSFWPPLWKAVSTPLLADWDRRFASPAERALLRERGLLLGDPGREDAPPAG
jgi:alkane 1-monooxygenase